MIDDSWFLFFNLWRLKFIQIYNFANLDWYIFQFLRDIKINDTFIFSKLRWNDMIDSCWLTKILRIKKSLTLTMMLYLTSLHVCINQRIKNDTLQLWCFSNWEWNDCVVIVICTNKAQFDLKLLCIEPGDNLCFYPFSK